MGVNNLKKEECNHKGQYCSAGVVTVNTDTGLTVFTLLYCKDCGLVVAKDITIRTISVTNPSVNQSPNVRKS